MKAYTTTFTAKSLNICRESCGGHGYAAVNRLGQLRSDHDIFQTFEGELTAGLARCMFADQRPIRYVDVCRRDLQHVPLSTSCPRIT